MEIKSKRVYTMVDVLRSTYKLYSEHNVGTLSAALSYYMIFSIAPVIIIVITLVGEFLGPHAAQGEVKDQLQGILGQSGAIQIENMIKSVYNPGKTFLTTAAATLFLIVGATTVFNQLRSALNTIWEVKPHAKKPVIEYFLTNAFSFGMIICVALLLLVSLVLNAGLTAFSDYIKDAFSGVSFWVISIAHHAMSLVASTILFAFVFKFLSDAKLKWMMVWEGALFTAVLFSVGKHLISFYIGTTHVSTKYGAVGSAVMLLLWVYYSSQIVFFGAQFTRALAMNRGYSLDPHAIESDEEAHSRADDHKDLSQTLSKGEGLNSQ
jgi:membrane protein